MMRRIIISNGAQYHTPFQVNEIFKNGISGKYITGIPKQKVSSLIAYASNGDVVCLYNYIVIFKVLSRIFPNFHNYLNYLSHQSFDWIASKHIDKCDIFHSFNGYALKSFEKLKTLNNGAIKIVECGIHPRYYAEVCNEEYKRYGSSKKSLFDDYVEKSELEFQQADYILTLTNICVKSFIQNGIDENKIISIPLGADVSSFSQSKSKNKQFTILYVGRVTILKGVQYLLEACDKMENLGFDFKLNIIGPITDLIIKKELNKYKAKKWLNIIGKVSRNNLKNYYSEAHVMVLPSLVDSFGMVVYESLACKTAVIITENVGAPIIKNEFGFIVPIRDSDSIVYNLIHMYENIEETILMGERGYKYVIKRTWAEYGNKIIDLYNNLTGYTL